MQSQFLRGSRHLPDHIQQLFKYVNRIVILFLIVVYPPELVITILRIFFIARYGLFKIFLRFIVVFGVVVNIA